MTKFVIGVGWASLAHGSFVVTHIFVVIVHLKSNMTPSVKRPESPSQIVISVVVRMLLRAVACTSTRLKKPVRDIFWFWWRAFEGV